MTYAKIFNLTFGITGDNALNLLWCLITSYTYIGKYI